MKIINIKQNLVKLSQEEWEIRELESDLQSLQYRLKHNYKYVEIALNEDETQTYEVKMTEEEREELKLEIEKLEIKLKQLKYVC